jgi:hypothetical protein
MKCLTFLKIILIFDLEKSKSVKEQIQIYYLLLEFKDKYTLIIKNNKIKDFVFIN